MFFIGLGWFSKDGEQVSSHGGDRDLESHSETVVKGLRADDAVLAGIHHKTSKTRVSRILLVEGGEEIRFVHSDNARDVGLAFETLDFCEHLLLVLSYCLVNDTFEDLDIALSAS